MKFNWGTGVAIFLVMFLIACGVFIVFAFNQDVNLVHKDYYQKGVDYTQEMNRDARSMKYKNQIEISEVNDSVRFVFPEEVVSTTNLVNVMFFRPSDHNLDIDKPLVFKGNIADVSKGELKSGRYIVKLTWKSDGLAYEIDKTFIIK